jgi:hypothetical protein
MADESSVRTVEVELPNGAAALIRATVLDDAAPLDEDEGLARKVAFGDRWAITEVTDALEGFAEAVRAAVSKAAPDKVTVEMSVEVCVKAGRLTALIAEGGGTAAFKVVLTWGKT